MSKSRSVKSIHESTTYKSSDERRAEGKALRDEAPREDHGRWKPQKNRRDPVDILNEGNEGGYRTSFRSGSAAWRSRPSPSIAARLRSWRPILPRRKALASASRPAATRTCRILGALPHLSAASFLTSTT